MTDLPPCQAASELRRLTDAALSAVAPDGAVLRHLHLDGGKLTLIDESGAPAWSGGLDAYRRIRVLGAGKGAAPMAAALENLLGQIRARSAGRATDQTHQDQGRRTPRPR